MLNLATSENIESICSDDPVRPNIPYIWRIEPPNKFTYYLTSRFIFEPPVSEKSKKAFTARLRTEIDAVCCVALLDDIPTTEKELVDFVDSLTNEQFEKVTDFFDSMPKVQHVVEVTNPKTKKKGEVVIDGVASFF